MDITAHYDEHPVFEQPENPDATLWRYLDFTKFVSLLDTRRLFFARADTFEDAFEGSYSRFNVAARPEVYKTAPAEMVAGLERVNRETRRWVFVNCWNMSEGESAALWGLYVPPTGGVAIRSTFRRLTEAFGPMDPLPEKDPTPRAYVGKVQYADYEHDWIPEGNLFHPFVHKRQSFDFEHEVRGVIQRIPTRGDEIDFTQEPPMGLNVAIDLGRLVEAIHISPTAPSWFADLVASVVRRYDCDAELVRSSLADDPVY